MTDIKSQEDRSRNMAAIHGKDTKPEIYFRKLLFSSGYRYRKNCADITGHPDIYLPKYKTAIFVHGCFWHRHKDCKYAYTPKSNVEFWQKKFDANIKRDQIVKNELNHCGIKCLIVWECMIHQMGKDPSKKEKAMDSINAFFLGDELYMEL